MAEQIGTVSVKLNVKVIGIGGKVRLTILAFFAKILGIKLEEKVEGAK